MVEKKIPVLDTLINDQWDVREYVPVYTKIFFYKNQTMIQSSFLFKTIEMVNGVESKRSPSVLKYYSFIFSANSLEGVLLDSSNLQTARTVKKDSLISKEWVFKDQIGEIFKTTNNRLVSSYADHNGDIIEEYSLVNKIDTSMKGICKLRFSTQKMSNIKFQLSPAIEKEKKMRMIEYRIINNARSLGVGQKSINRIEIPYLMSELNIKNESEIKKMFEFAKMKLEHIN